MAQSKNFDIVGKEIIESFLFCMSFTLPYPVSVDLRVRTLALPLH